MPQCQRVSETHGQCTRRATSGGNFCGLHACPACGNVKPSTATTCGACVPTTAPPSQHSHDPPQTVPPPQAHAPASRCHRVSDNGQCLAPPEPGKQFCARHAHFAPDCKGASSAVPGPEHGSPRPSRAAPASDGTGPSAAHALHSAGGGRLPGGVEVPDDLLEFAVGPLGVPLVPQPTSPITMHRLVYDAPRTFVVKKAHLDVTDWRCWDASAGQRRLVFNSHHPGKNLLGGVDPLGLAGTEAPGGEWKSLTDVSGDGGGFQIRPKSLSRALPLTLRHGRTNINLPDGRTVFNISRRSKLRTKSFQAQLSVAEGESKRAALIVLADMAKRTMKVINPQNDLVCLIQKPVKTLLLNAAFGAGSELRVDVAPGVDCSALLGVVFGITCMGQSMAKDVFGNFVAEPLTEAAVEEVLDDPGAVLDLAEQGGEALGLDFDAVWEGVGTGLAAAGGCVLELFAGS